MHMLHMPNLIDSTREVPTWEVPSQNEIEQFANTYKYIATISNYDKNRGEGNICCEKHFWESTMDMFNRDTTHYNTTDFTELEIPLICKFPWK